MAAPLDIEPSQSAWSLDQAAGAETLTCWNVLSSATDPVGYLGVAKYDIAQLSWLNLEAPRREMWESHRVILLRSAAPLDRDSFNTPALDASVGSDPKAKVASAPREIPRRSASVAAWESACADALDCGLLRLSATDDHRLPFGEFDVEPDLSWVDTQS